MTGCDNETVAWALGAARAIAGVRCATRDSAAAAYGAQLLHRAGDDELLASASQRASRRTLLFGPRQRTRRLQRNGGTAREVLSNGLTGERPRRGDGPGGGQ